MGVRAGVKIWATLLALALGAPPALALDKITIGETGSGSATHWPTYVAMTKGFFKALDIEVEFVPAPSSAAVMQQLAAGSLALGVSGPGDAARAIDKGAPVRLLRVESQTAPYEVMGKPIYKSLADLRGKIVMVGGAKDITRYYIDRMAAPPVSCCAFTPPLLRARPCRQDGRSPRPHASRRHICDGGRRG